MGTRHPIDVIPPPVSRAVSGIPYWFVIGGQAMRQVFRQEVNESLLLRALTYFDDADREARLPGEGPEDWQTVKEFFRTRVGHLLIPPARELEIEKRVVDVAES